MKWTDLRAKLNRGDFVITLELDPPKGSDPLPTLDAVRPLARLVDAVNIADCPMANVRMSPIALSYLVQRDLGLETIFHLTCRDRNLIGLQSELLGAAAMGVRNILALTGDTPDRGDHPTARGVFDLDSTGLVALASRLNSGRDLAVGELNHRTDFLVGVAVDPGAPDLPRETAKIQAKIEAGANFVQTQPVFDAETVLRFQEQAVGLDIPVLFGILPLRSHQSAIRLMQRVPGIRVPEPVLRRLEAAGPAGGLQYFAELLQRLAPLVQGVHFFPMGRLDPVAELIRGLRPGVRVAAR
jgi:5,10-methylenetetrahydrofolate reductase